MAKDPLPWLATNMRDVLARLAKLEKELQGVDGAQLVPPRPPSFHFDETVSAFYPSVPPGLHIPRVYQADADDQLALALSHILCNTATNACNDKDVDEDDGEQYEYDAFDIRAVVDLPAATVAPHDDAVIEVSDSEDMPFPDNFSETNATDADIFEFSPQCQRLAERFEIQLNKMPKDKKKESICKLMDCEDKLCKLSKGADCSIKEVRELLRHLLHHSDKFDADTNSDDHSRAATLVAPAHLPDEFNDLCNVLSSLVLKTYVYKKHDDVLVAPDVNPVDTKKEKKQVKFTVDSKFVDGDFSSDDHNFIDSVDCEESVDDPCSEDLLARIAELEEEMGIHDDISDSEYEECENYLYEGGWFEQ